MQILHEDDALIVINKDAGLPTAPGGWNTDSSPPENTTDLLRHQFGRIWIVHRLDKGTSGVLVFARQADVHRALSQQFESHQVHKVYHALTCGLPAWQEYTCQSPLRANVGHHHRTVVDSRGGKPASTQFKVLELFQAGAFIQASPETGRTHQIRAHLASLGLPLLGDILYGSPDTPAIDRPALHSFSIEFSLNGREYSITAPHPGDFIKACEFLREQKPGSSL